ncbi:hypothetical protein CHUAL_001741 [Chamberlinius hualienensis]
MRRMELCRRQHFHHTVGIESSERNWPRLLDVERHHLRTKPGYYPYREFRTDIDNRFIKFKQQRHCLHRRFLCCWWIFLLLMVTVVNGQVTPREDRQRNNRPNNNNNNSRNRCPNCMIPNDDAQRQAVDNLRIETIKIQILSKLGLKHKPNITMSIPREVVLDTLWKADEGMDLLNPTVQGNRAKTEPADDYYARTSEIITFAEPGGSLNSQTLLQFSNRHDNPHGLRVKAATLWVQLKFRAPLQRHFRHVYHDRKITLYVFRVLRSSSTNDSQHGVTLELLTSIRMSVKHVGWKKFDLQETVQKWFSGPLGQKLSLLIDCAGCGSLVQPIFFAEDLLSSSSSSANRRHSEASNAQRGYRPFLAIVTEPVPLHRVRRRALDCDSRTTQCCKKSLYISFKLLQWDDWIIAPQGYYANYCMGDCSKRGRTPDTFTKFHTHVIEEYKNKNPYATIQQCCAPSKLGPMSLIYFDQDSNIIKTDLPNMIVEECGCA